VGHRERRLRRHRGGPWGLPRSRRDLGYKYGFLSCLGGELFTGDWREWPPTAADHQYVARSTDGGLSWRPAFAPEGNVWAFSATVTGLVAGGDSQGTPMVWTSTDDGASWIPVPPTGGADSAHKIVELWAGGVDDIWAVGMYYGGSLLHFN
jgi:hypothetical protein